MNLRLGIYLNILGVILGLVYGRNESLNLVLYIFFLVLGYIWNYIIDSKWNLRIKWYIG